MIRDFFERERLAGRPMVAAFVISTAGSTYRKPGAYMLFSSSGERHGLLSGGCLEGDLQEHALQLLGSGSRCRVKHYDSRGSDDPIWGLGLGCEGAMQILLLRIDASNGFQPLAGLFEASDKRVAAAFATDIETGSVTPSASACTELSGKIFTVAAERTLHVLICGAGPDAEPVATFSRWLGWRVTVVDHRSAYVDPQRFDPKVELRHCDLSDFATSVTLSQIDAAIVMSHHLTADAEYLSALSGSDIPYVGLLGPAARRERLFSMLGARAEILRSRLRAPIGLDLGGRTPEAIALAIVAEIQAVTNDRSGASFSSVLDRR